MEYRYNKTQGGNNNITKGKRKLTSFNLAGHIWLINSNDIFT